MKATETLTSLHDFEILKGGFCCKVQPSNNLISKYYSILTKSYSHTVHTDSYRVTLLYMQLHSHAQSQYSTGTGHCIV